MRIWKSHPTAYPLYSGSSSRADAVAGISALYPALLRLTSRISNQRVEVEVKFGGPGFAALHIVYSR